MVWAVIKNHEGETEDFRKPCFGFMSYANQWEETDEWDDDEGEYFMTSKDGFETANLSTMTFYPELSGHLTSEEVKLGWAEKYLPKLYEAIKGLPQYYSSLTIEMDENDEDQEPEFIWNLQDANMQVTIIGAMMIRNILQYASMRRTFTIMIDAGFDVKIAFIMAQRYSSNLVTFGTDKGKYLAYPSAGGDESIFSDGSCICDVVAMYKGELGYIYQGLWGDTENGYGRYGEYDGGCAPRFERADRCARITDTVLVAEGYSDSKSLYELEGALVPSHRFSDEELVAIANQFKEAIEA